MSLICQKDLFDLPEDIIYLNCASQSPQLKTVTALGQIAVAWKARPWTYPTKDRFAKAEKARSLFARLINASPDDIAIIPSASYGVTTASVNLPLKAGQNIVMVAEEFPSDVYPWREVARQHSANIVTVAKPDHYNWTKALLDNISSDTAIVSVPNCHWTDGGLIDLIQISAKARAVGAALVVDATQSVGVYPLDVKVIQPDFLVAASYKWLFGPYSLGFMYVHPRWQTGKPIELGWLNRAGSDDYSKVADYQEEYHTGARRYDVGERNDFVLVPMINAALEQLWEWGVDNLQAYISELTSQLETQVIKFGWEVSPAALRVGHIVGLRKEGVDMVDLAAKLAASNIFASVRGTALRLSPHVYNTSQDMEKVAALLAKTTKV